MTCTCGKPTRDAAYVCDDCLGHLSRMLGQVPWVDETSADPVRGIDYRGSSSSGSKEQPAPMHASVVEARHRLHTALVQWVMFCDAEQIRHQSRSLDLPADNLTALSRWLLWRVDGLGLHELGGDAVSEIGRAVGKLLGLLDNPPDRVVAGPCDECGNVLYAQHGRDLVKCHDCGEQYDVASRRDAMREHVRGMWVTEAEARRLLMIFGLAVAERTIRKWRERNRIAWRDGFDHEGRERFMYLMDDLLTRAAEVERKGA